MVQYRIVYDAATIPFQFPRAAFLGLIPLGFGLLILRLPHTWFESMPRFGRVFGGILMAFGLGLLSGLPIATWQWRAGVRDRLQAGAFTLVEGTVTDFVAGQADCHPMEHFTVSGHTYTYCPYDASGFNQVSTDGGPIRPGLGVRIADIDGNIQRLEILR